MCRDRSSTLKRALRKIYKRHLIQRRLNCLIQMIITVGKLKDEKSASALTYYRSLLLGASICAVPLSQPKLFLEQAFPRN